MQEAGTHAVVTHGDEVGVPTWVIAPAVHWYGVVIVSVAFPVAPAPKPAAVQLSVPVVLTVQVDPEG